MQYTAVLATLLTGALALPQMATVDNSIFVTLQGPGELATQTPFTTVQMGHAEEKAPVGSSGPYTNVTLNAKGAFKDLRCKILDDAGKPIVILRDPNIDITFSDADKGDWDFKNGPQYVSKIICDPTFVKIPPGEEKDVTIILTGPEELATQTTLLFAGASLEAQQPQGSFGPYDHVELQVGLLVDNQDLRCKIKDAYGNDIIVFRDPNTDVTFSDKGKGPWAFKKPTQSEVHSIICDPSFKPQKIVV